MPIDKTLIFNYTKHMNYKEMIKQCYKIEYYGIKTSAEIFTFPEVRTFWSCDVFLKLLAFDKKTKDGFWVTYGKEGDYAELIKYKNDVLVTLIYDDKDRVKHLVRKDANGEIFKIVRSGSGGDASFQMTPSKKYNDKLKCFYYTPNGYYTATKDGKPRIKFATMQGDFIPNNGSIINTREKSDYVQNYVLTKIQTMCDYCPITIKHDYGERGKPNF